MNDERTPVIQDLLSVLRQRQAQLPLGEEAQRWEDASEPDDTETPHEAFTRGIIETAEAIGIIAPRVGRMLPNTLRGFTEIIGELFMDEEEAEIVWRVNNEQDVGEVRVDVPHTSFFPRRWNEGIGEGEPIVEGVDMDGVIHGADLQRNPDYPDLNREPLAGAAPPISAGEVPDLIGLAESLIGSGMTISETEARLSHLIRLRSPRLPDDFMLASSVVHHLLSQCPRVPGLMELQQDINRTAEQYLTIHGVEARIALVDRFLSRFYAFQEVAFADTPAHLRPLLRHPDADDDVEEASVVSEGDNKVDVSQIETTGKKVSADDLDELFAEIDELTQEE